jgi:hypothetical protein
MLILVVAMIWFIKKEMAHDGMPRREPFSSFRTQRMGEAEETRNSPIEYTTLSSQDYG